MFGVPRFVGERSTLDEDDFYDLLAKLQQMSESERTKFASDQHNTALLEHYNLYLDRLAFRVLLPLATLVVMSIVAGVLVA